jgi:hypothetical protein
VGQIAERRKSTGSPEVALLRADASSLPSEASRADQDEPMMQ